MLGLGFKRNGDSLQDSGEKRPRLGEPVVEYFLEQRLVGWIIGKGGATLREIEQAHDVKVTLDQSSKSSGYSKLQISGLDVKIKEAVDHINISLSSSGHGNSGSPPCLLESIPSHENKDELQVKQRFVGYLLGKAGAAISDIEKASGCQIFVNQETKGLGYSTVQLMGSPVQIAEARQAIEGSIERAKAAREGQAAEESVEIDQCWVGWLLGKKGGLVQEIQQETGAQITIDQSTSTLGYSTVVLKGNPDQVDSARERVNASLEKAGAAPMTKARAPGDGLHSTHGSRGGGGSNINTQVTVEQQWVGWLLGKNGAAVKDLEATTGAKIVVNQDTKALGYSIISLSGTPFQVQAAYDAMTESLRRAGGALSELPGGRSGGKRHDQGLTDAVWKLASTLVEHAGQDALWRIFPSLQETLSAHPDVVESLTALVPLRYGQLALQRTPAQQAAQQAAHTMDIQVEQKVVGWLLGGRGKTVQQIEEESGAKINIDQSTKDAGYSIVHVYGSLNAVQQAERRIQASIGILSSPAKGPPMQDGESTDMDIEQRLVGWILGKSGTVLKQIQSQSGAFVSIDQSTKELGFSKLRITGSFANRQIAHNLIEMKLAEAALAR